jgi:hypothetical protein
MSDQDGAIRPAAERSTLDGQLARREFEESRTFGQKLRPVSFDYILFERIIVVLVCKAANQIPHSAFL